MALDRESWMLIRAALYVAAAVGLLVIGLLAALT